MHEEKAADPRIKVKQEIDDSPPPSDFSTPTGFGSRLNIKDFLCSTTASISTRTSPRSLTKKRVSTDSQSPSPQSPSPSKKPRSRIPAAPASAYAHLPLLPDAIGPDLLVLFVGLNPGLKTAQLGHAYAHPSNLFWKLLHSSGITPRRCLPSEDQDLPRLYGLGNTNIVARPTRNGAELTRKEMDDSVKALEAKVAMWRPEVVAIVGKSIWESIWRTRHGGRGMRKEEFRYGWQAGEEERFGGSGADDGWKGARVFVATSTSGLAASSSPAEKLRVWRELGVWVAARREGMVKEEPSQPVKTESGD